jgi:integrase
MSLFSAYFVASRCINPKERGGRGLPAKVVQDLLGHSSITTLTGIYFRAAMTAPNWRKRLLLE